jgi:hypothetical protein
VHRIGSFFGCCHSCVPGTTCRPWHSVHVSKLSHHSLDSFAPDARYFSRLWCTPKAPALPRGGRERGLQQAPTHARSNLLANTLVPVGGFLQWTIVVRTVRSNTGSRYCGTESGMIFWCDLKVMYARSVVLWCGGALLHPTPINERGLQKGHLIALKRSAALRIAARSRMLLCKHRDARPLESGRLLS